VVGNGRAVCVPAERFAAVPVGCAVAACVADDVCDPDDACDADGLADADDAAAADPDVCADADADAWAEVLVAPDDVALDGADAVPECPWPVGDGVRVPAWITAELGVCVAGVTVDGVPEPVPMHPVTVAARSTAPAPERPANSNRACAPGMVRRIFMNPPPI
jgi:hypothetical protein